MHQEISVGLVYVIAFVVGCIIGGYLNLLIYCLPRKVSFYQGYRLCKNCSQRLRWQDKIPVISYLLCRGKCRYCDTPLLPHSLVVELLGGLLAFLSVALYDLTPLSLCVFAFSCGLLVIAFVDIDTMTIPDRLLAYLIIPAVLLGLFFPGVTFLSRIIGIFAVSVPLYILAVVFEDSFGGGDIKLMAVCGFVLGWQLSLMVLFIAILTCGIYVVGLLLSKKITKDQHISFGQFLSLGVMLSLFWGRPLIDWYLNIF